MKQCEKYLKKCHKARLNSKEYNPATISCFSIWNNSNAILNIPNVGIWSISHKTAEAMINRAFIQEQFNGSFIFDLQKYKSNTI